MHSKWLLLSYRMNVSKSCGPFRNHIYMFHVLRGDILKLQEVNFERKKIEKTLQFDNTLNLSVVESLFMAIDNVPGSTGCHWIGSADIMVFTFLIRFTIKTQFIFLIHLLLS